VLITWLKAHDAVEAGSALADTFPTQSAGDAIRNFVRTATQELQARKLNFYERVRFANAFKWRLLEKGVAAETAHDITQTLLIGAISGATPAAPVATAPRTVSPAPNAKDPVNRKSLDALFREAAASFERGAYEDAVAQYQQYTAARPRDTAAFNNLGVALTQLGYTTTLVGNAVQALEELSVDADRFDVVFSDVVMPGLSGIELAQQIRRLRPNLPIVLTSGYSQVLAQQGSYGFELLQKPYSIEQLSRMLHRVSGSRMKRDAASQASS